MKLIKKGLFNLNLNKVRLLHDNKRNWYYCQYSVFGLIWYCASYDYGIAVFTHIGDSTLESLRKNGWVYSIYKQPDIKIVERDKTNWLTRFF